MSKPIQSTRAAGPMTEHDATQVDAAREMIRKLQSGTWETPVSNPLVQTPSAHTQSSPENILNDLCQNTIIRGLIGNMEKTRNWPWQKKQNPVLKALKASNLYEAGRLLNAAFKRDYSVTAQPQNSPGTENASTKPAVSSVYLDAPPPPPEILIKQLIEANNIYANRANRTPKNLQKLRDASNAVKGNKALLYLLKNEVKAKVTGDVIKPKHIAKLNVAFHTQPQQLQTHAAHQTTDTTPGASASSPPGEAVSAAVNLNEHQNSTTNMPQRIDRGYASFSNVAPDRNTPTPGGEYSMKGLGGASSAGSYDNTDTPMNTGGENARYVGLRAIHMRNAGAQSGDATLSPSGQPPPTDNITTSSSHRADATTDANGNTSTKAAEATPPTSTTPRPSS